MWEGERGGCGKKEEVGVGFVCVVYSSFICRNLNKRSGTLIPRDGVTTGVKIFAMNGCRKNLDVRRAYRCICGREGLFISLCMAGGPREPWTGRHL